METYSEELRTPPVPLISLVGLPELHQAITGFLQSANPPFNSLALPDFSAFSFLSRKPRDPLLSGRTFRQPAGILMRGWLSKHRARVPAAVAALFASSQATGSRRAISGRNTKLVVVVVQSDDGDDVDEEQVISLTRRAEIDAKYLAIFVQKGPSQIRESLIRLGSLFAELCNAYYWEEGQQLKALIEKKSFAFRELHVHYCFKNFEETRLRL